MDYKIEESNGQVRIRNIRDFNPRHIFECGQAFRWEKEEDETYTTIAYGRVINVSMEEGDLILSNTNMEDFKGIWYDYFDLGTDYQEIKEELNRDEILKTATTYGYGIRILNQEPFETLISFIISANNQIPRIKNSIRLIAENYGELIGEYRGRKHYSFPSPEKLSQVDVKELREISRIGFRDQRVIDTSKMVVNKEIDLDSIFAMSKDEAKKELQILPGVGPKVADCALLFAFKKGDAFPVDTWVKRVMEYFYIKEETPVSKIGRLGDELFGELAGYAQQYLFYYAREEDIGK